MHVLEICGKILKIGTKTWKIWAGNKYLTFPNILNSPQAAGEENFSLKSCKDTFAFQNSFKFVDLAYIKFNSHFKIMKKTPRTIVEFCESGKVGTLAH